MRHRLSRSLEAGTRGPAVLWDLDCTLVDTFELLFQAYRHAVGSVLDRALTREQLARELGPPLPLHMERYSAAHVQPLMEAFQAFYDQHHDDYARLFGGVEQVLREGRRRGWKQAVVTSRGGRNTHRRLQSLGLGGVFDAVVTARDTERPKPDPAPIYRALEKLGADPAEAFVVGDDIVDIQAARGAGVASVAALWGARDVAALLASGPDHRAEKPADLLAIVPTGDERPGSEGRPPGA